MINWAKEYICDVHCILEHGLLLFEFKFGFESFEFSLDLNWKLKRKRKKCLRVGPSLGSCVGRLLGRPTGLHTGSSRDHVHTRIIN